MKTNSPQTILAIIAVCLLLFNINLLYLNHQNKNRLTRVAQDIQRLEYLKNVEYMLQDSKELTVARFNYEQFHIGDATVYIGSDRNAVMPLRRITEQPKL